MNLHILTKAEIPEIVLHCVATDGIILIREAVYALLQHLPAAFSARKIYVLQADWEARGGISWQLPANVQIIQYAEFVTLCTQYNNSITW